MSFSGGAKYRFVYVCRKNDNDLYIRPFIYEATRGARAQSVTVNRLVVGSIPTRGDEIFT